MPICARYDDNENIDVSRGMMGWHGTRKEEEEGKEGKREGGPR